MIKCKGNTTKIWLLALSAFVFVAGCGSSNRDTDAAAPTVHSAVGQEMSAAGLNSETFSLPIVLFTTPIEGATEVALNSTVNATFNQEVSSARLNAARFILQRGSTAVAGKVTHAGTMVTFLPEGNLESGVEYTATITTEVKDAAGNTMTFSHEWSFTTVSAAEGVTQPGG